MVALTGQRVTTTGAPCRRAGRYQHWTPHEQGPLTGRASVCRATAPKGQALQFCYCVTTSRGSCHATFSGAPLRRGRRPHAATAARQARARAANSARAATGAVQKRRRRHRT